MIKRFSLLLSFLLCINGFAQQKTIDSLLQIIPHQLDDTNKVNTLNDLCSAYHNNDVGSFKKIISYANQTITLAKKLNYKKGLANAYWQLGFGQSYDTYYNDKVVNYREGLHNYFKAEKLALELNDVKFLARICYDIGDDYEYESDYTKALGYFIRSVRYAEESGNQISEIRSQLRIATIYNSLSDRAQSMQYFQSAYELSKKSKDTSSVIKALNGIGIAYRLNLQHELSLKTHNEALALATAYKDSSTIGLTLLDIGKVYFDQKKYDEALSRFFKGYNFISPSNERRPLCTALSSIANVYYQQKNYTKALEYYKRYFDISTEIGLSEDIAEAEKSMSATYEQMADYKQALDHYKKATLIQDSLTGFEKTKEFTQHQMQYEYDKKDAIEKAEQAAELKRSELIRNTSIIGLILALALAFFILRGYNQKKKANEIISQQKREVEIQKEISDQRNKEIMASISYAKRIQSAILPAIEDLENKFAEAFVLFKPKAVVSGDFYWLHENDNYIFYATADCTGHGVPGGFMSMLGSSLLNEIIIERNVIEPSQVLDQLRNKIISALKQKGAIGENQDGMDIVLCRIDKQNKILTYSAANNPLWIISNNTLTEYSYDKQPVGISIINTKLFTQKSIQLNSGDRIYTFTDGYADQFGGVDGKKFKYKQFKQLVQSIHSLPMSQQKKDIDKTFEDWRGQYEQIDDVCVIGVKI